MCVCVSNGVVNEKSNFFLVYRFEQKKGAVKKIVDGIWRSHELVLNICGHHIFETDKKKFNEILYNNNNILTIDGKNVWR